MASLTEKGKERMALLEQAESSGKITEKGRQVLASLRQVSGVEQPAEAPQEPSVIQKIAGAYQSYKDSPLSKASPVGMLETANEMANKGFDKAGEFVAEQGGLRKINPNVAAAAGTALSMIPDIAQSAYNPVKASSKVIPQLAAVAERRALGLTAPELSTSFGRKKSAVAARKMLEQGVTSATGSPQVLFDKASALKGSTGRKIGEIRESVGPQPIQPILKKLDDYASDRLKGATGGKWDKAKGKIKKAKDTIIGIVKKDIVEATPEVVKDTGLLGAQGQPIKKIIPAKEGYVPPASLKRIAEAKKEIGDVVNWFASNVSQAEAKNLSNTIEKGIEESLASAGGDIKTYKALKPIYSAAKTAIKGLNRELGKQQGNMAVSLPSMVVGAAGGAGAVAKVGAAEVLKRRGAGIAASELMGAANAPKKLGLPLLNATRVLTEDKARELLREAKGDREKARKLAKERNFEIPE